MTTATASTITEEQVEFYHENGFLLMPKLLPDDVLQALRDETDRIVAEGGRTDRPQRAVRPRGLAHARRSLGCGG